jgi:hypothetical protein
MIVFMKHRRNILREHVTYIPVVDSTSDWGVITVSYFSETIEQLTSFDTIY